MPDKMPGMPYVLLALAVAFAAFCVWLGVRIVNRRERWAKWTLAATLSLPVLYIFGFGLAVRNAAVPLPIGGLPKYAVPKSVSPHAFWPIGWLVEALSDTDVSKTKILFRYMDLWMPDGSVVAIPMNADGSKSWRYAK
ncbi:MAG TPA: hypothetical protein VGM05_20055 [Planctomycetaceae bacterium]|jgi:hypothetical protein